MGDYEYKAENSDFSQNEIIPVEDPRIHEIIEKMQINNSKLTKNENLIETLNSLNNLNIKIESDILFVIIKYLKIEDFSKIIDIKPFRNFLVNNIDSVELLDLILSQINLLQTDFTFYANLSLTIFKQTKEYKYMQEIDFELLLKNFKESDNQNFFFEFTNQYLILYSKDTQDFEYLIQFLNFLSEIQITLKNWELFSKFLSEIFEIFGNNIHNCFQQYFTQQSKNVFYSNQQTVLIEYISRIMCLFLTYDMDDLLIYMPIDEINSIFLQICK